MATLADGTYIIVNKSHQLAVDVRGGSSDGGTTIMSFAPSTTDDAQIANVITRDGKRLVSFPLTAGWMDDGNGQHTLFQEYDSGSGAQVWTIADASTTGTFNGTTYACFTIADYAGYLLKCPSTSGTRLSCVSATATDEMRWMFVPVQTLKAGGTYRIVPASCESWCADNGWFSRACGGHVITCGYGGGTNQIWQVASTGTVGLYRFVNAYSGLSMDVYGGYTNPGNRIQIFTPCATENQEFMPVLSGTMSVGGVEVPTYAVHCKTGTGLVMDCGGSRYAGYAEYSINHDYANLNQRFAFVPVEVLADDITAPTDVGGTTDAIGSPLATIQTRGTSGIRCSMTSAGSSFECRYRIRTRAVGKPVGAWGQWLSIADSTPGNDGWGDAWVANMAVSSVGSSHVSTATVPVTLATDGNDHAEVEFQVRRLEASWGVAGAASHGPETDAVVSVVWQPVVTLGAVSFSGDGLTIALSSDYARPGNSANLSAYLADGTTVLKDYKVSSLDASCSVIVPLSELRVVPADKAAMTVSGTWWTDSSSVPLDLSGTVAYDASSGLTVSPTVTTGTGATRIVTMTATTDDRLWVVVPDGFGGRRFEEVKASTVASGKRTFVVAHPFGVAYELFVRSSDGSKWGTWHVAYAACDDYLYAWNWVDGNGTRRFASVSLGKDEPPSPTRTLEADVTEQKVGGSTSPAYHFGSTVTRDLSVKGVVLPGRAEEGEDVASLSALARTGADGYDVLFRGPYGDYAHVAVSAVEVPQQLESIVEVSVTQREGMV